MGKYSISIRNLSNGEFLFDITRVLANGILPREGETILIGDKEYIVQKVEHSFEIKLYSPSEEVHEIDLYVKRVIENDD